jgi:hypothetical protein
MYDSRYFACTLEASSRMYLIRCITSITISSDQDYSITQHAAALFTLLV